MENILPYLFASTPFIVVVLLAAIGVVGIGIGMVRPRLLVYPYLCLFFWCNSIHFGSLNTMAMPGVYTRGSGLLMFSLVLWYMLGAWCCARVAATFRGMPAPACNLRSWFLGWLTLLVCHVVTAVFLNVKVTDALSPSGFANIVWMAPLISLMLLTFGRREYATELMRFILLAALGRALFGLVRFAFFGGDPNNVYANMNEVNIKLTFFDINDSLLCAIAFAIAAVNLFQVGQFERARFWRLVEWATLCATGLCIVLSFRRSAWGGLILAGLIIMLRFPVRRRIELAIVGVPVVCAGILYAATKRLGQTKSASKGLSSFFYDMQSHRFGAESQRVLELKLAFADFIAHPFAGIGSWGRYAGFERIDWQSSPDGGLFLHSGILHVALKSGVIGLVLFFGVAWAFVRFARHAIRTVPPEFLGLATAGLAGCAFVIPELLIGTPIPQVRATQMIAFCLALPYVAMAACSTARETQPVKVVLVPVRRTEVSS